MRKAGSGRARPQGVWLSCNMAYMFNIVIDLDAIIYLYIIYIYYINIVISMWYHIWYIIQLLNYI